jgi:nitrogen fixation/metabolism regulation signal transduction histidine kinase
MPDLDDEETKRHLDEIFNNMNDPVEIQKRRMETVRKKISEDKDFCL